MSSKKDFFEKQVRLWLPVTEDDFEKGKHLLEGHETYFDYTKFLHDSGRACKAIGMDFKVVPMSFQTIQLMLKDMGLKESDEGYTELMKSEFPDEELELQEIAKAIGFSD